MRMTNHLSRVRVRVGVISAGEPSPPSADVFISTDPVPDGERRDGKPVFSIQQITSLYVNPYGKPVSVGGNEVHALREFGIVADGWEDDEEANAADAERDARRLAFLDDLGALGVDLDDDGDEDPPYMAPIVALPGFAPIASLDRVATLAEALRHTPTDVAARLTPEQRTAWQAAQDYTPT